MNIIEELKITIELLNKIDEYRNQLPAAQSLVDGRLEDLYHYIENNNLNTSQRYKIIGEIQKLRRERRIIKNNNWISKSYETHINKLNNESNRKMLLAELNKTNKQLDAKYKNRVYTEEELKKLVG